MEQAWRLRFNKQFLREQYARNIAAAIAAGGLVGGVDEPEQKPLPLDKKEEKPDPAAALKADLAAKEARLAEFEAKAKKADDEKKKAADAKAIEEGKAKELLATREAELAADREKLAVFEKREKAMAQSMFDKLDDKQKEAAKLLQGKLQPADFIEYMSTLGVAPTVEAPPPGTPGRSTSGKKLRELHPETKEVLGNLYADETVYRAGQHLDVVDTSEGKKFTMSPQRFVKALRARSQMGSVQAWSADAVDKVMGAH